jgi:hypothetical protein
MSRSTIHRNKDYFIHDNDPIDLDEVDDLGYKDGTNDRILLIHSPDVDVDADHEEDSFAFGVDKCQYKANGEVDKVVDKEANVNRGRVGKAKSFLTGELLRRFDSWTIREILEEGDNDE